MSNEDRKVGLSSEFDASGIKSGVEQAKDALKTIPGAAREAAAGAAAPMEEVGKKTEAAAKKTEAATKSLISQIQRTDTALASGGRNTAAYFESIAKQRGIDPNVLAPYLAQLRATEAAQNAAGKSLENVGMSAKATAAALRGVPAQFTDIVTSLASGQQPLTVLLQQGGQLKDMFGGVGNAARALGGYVVGLVNPLTLTAAAIGGIALAAYQGSQELPKLQKQLILTGDAAGYTLSRLAGARDAVAELSGATKGRSAEVLADIASSAGIGADNLERFTVAAIRFERAGGEAAEKTADAFKSLAKDPLAAALKLNETTNFLTRSTYEQIAALVEQGRTADAARIAQEAYFDAINQRIPKLEENLGLLQRAWRAATDGAKGFWDAALDIGREDSLDQKLKKAQESLALWQGLGSLGSGPMGNALGGLFGNGGMADSARERVRALEEQKRGEEDIARQQAEQLKQVQAQARWREQANKFLSDAQQLELAITKAKNDGLAAGVSQVEIEKQIALLRERADPRLYQERIATEENARSESIKRGIIEINGLRARGALNEYETIDRLYQLEQRQLLSQRQAIAEQLSYAQQRQNSEKEVAGLQVQLAANSEAQRTAALKHNNDIANALHARAVAAEQANEAERELNRAATDADAARRLRNLTDYAAGLKQSAEAIEQESGMLQVQASLMGVTQAARDRAIEFYRIELDLKKQIRAIDDLETPNGEADREALRAEARAQAAQRRLLAQQRQFVDETNRQIDTIADGLTDALLRGFESGKGFAQNFVDTLKNMFSTLVLKPIIEPIFRSVAGDFLSFLGGGAGGAPGSMLTSALGGAGGGSSLFSSLGSLGSFGMQLAGLKGIFGAGAQLTGLTGAGTGLALEGSASMIANGSITQGLAQGAGALAPWALGAGLGIYGGRAISGGYSVGGSGNTPVNIGTALGAVFAGPIGAAIGGVIGGVVNRAFGRGPKEVSESGIEGTIGGSEGDFSGQTYANWKQKGGWFRSNKYGTDFGAVSDELDDMLDTSAGLLLKTTSEWAKSLGLPAEALAQVTTKIKTKLTGNAEEDQKAIEGILTQYQEALTAQFKDALLPFQKAGEDLTATLQRLVGLQQFSDTINSLGGVFSKVARSSVDAREGLLALVGGADQFIQMATGFVGNYYSRDEIAGGKAAGVRDTLAGLGITNDFSAGDAKAQFRQLVEGTDISTAEGQKRLATLLGIQGDFSDVANYLAETGKSLSQVSMQAPQSELLAPLLASGTTQQVKATNEVKDAIDRLIEVVKEQGGGGAADSGGSDYVSSRWAREVGLASSR